MSRLISFILDNVIKKWIYALVICFVIGIIGFNGNFIISDDADKIVSMFMILFGLIMACSSNYGSLVEGNSMKALAASVLGICITSLLFYFVCVFILPIFFKSFVLISNNNWGLSFNMIYLSMVVITIIYYFIRWYIQDPILKAYS